MRVERVVARDPRAAGAARRAVAAALVASGRPDLQHDVALIVSELVTNALRHSTGPIRLRATLTSGTVRVEVEDGTPAALPAVRPPHLDEVDGRGLVLVQRVSARWGWDRRPTGKVVWAEVATGG